MEVAAQIAVVKGLLTGEHAQRQYRLLRALDLPVKCSPMDIESVLETMQRDKKVRTGRMRWVLPTRIGHAGVFNEIPFDIVRNAIEKVVSRQ
jgi:3-dehydroquinate synthetase